MEKWILRQAFEDILPADILWRAKKQFDEGSGTVDLLDQALKGAMSQKETRARRNTYPEAKLRCAEECFYHKLFMQVFERPEPILQNVARWAERPDLSV